MNDERKHKRWKKELIKSHAEHLEQAVDNLRFLCKAMDLPFDYKWTTLKKDEIVRKVFNIREHQR